MIALAVSLFIILAATGLLVSAKTGYVSQSDHAQISDTGRFAIEAISRTLRQASYSNWDAMEGAVVNLESIGTAFAGMDARSLKSRTVGLSSPVTKSINGSDVLAVGIFGAGSGENGDGTMLNCAGFGIGAEGSSGESAEDEDRDWSIFYVAEDSTGEPELYCKYRGNDGWASQAIARGVETFQVLYGIDTDGDLVPNKFLSASSIDALDNTLMLLGPNAVARAIEKNKKSHWRRVVAVKFALLVRGANVSRSGSTSAVFDLFGKEYADANASADPGVRIRESEMREAVRARERRLFLATVQLRSTLRRGAL